MSIPISVGSGAASVAAEAVGGLQYQQIEVYGRGATSVLGINPDGSINASIIGIPNVAVAGGSVGLLGGTAFIGNVGIASGSVLALATGNQSVSGTVGASVIGVVPIQLSNSSVITVAQGSIATVIIGGSIAASFTPPANQSVSGTVQVDIRGSVATVIIGGSIAASFTPPANQSVSGTAGASIIGQLPAGTAVLGSVAALQGTNPWVVVSSLTGGIFPIAGSVAATIIGTTNVAGSVAAFIVGNSSVITYIQNSSILAVPVGSTITVWQNPSIVGTYAEDAPSASGDKGFLVMGARNDTLASVTSTDGDYSSHVVGPAGELIAENAPLTKWVQGTADFRQGNTGASILVIPQATVSIFTYVTGVQIANMGSASVLVTLVSGGSTLGYSIAPAGGGSNIYYQNALKTPAGFGFAASTSGVASVLVSAQGFISKT